MFDLFYKPPWATVKRSLVQSLTYSSLWVLSQFSIEEDDGE